MIIRSTKLDLTAEPFLLVLLKRVLCSRCGLSSDKLPTENGKNELKLFLRGLFYEYKTFLSTVLRKAVDELPFASLTTDRMYPSLLPVIEAMREDKSNCPLMFPCPSALPISNFWKSPPLTEYSKVRLSQSMFFTLILGWVKVRDVLQIIIPKINEPKMLIGKIYCFIKNEFKVCDKYTHNFLTFYKFEKFDRALAKSFNSFLLPLKFIRRDNVAMEHNEQGFAPVKFLTYEKQ